MNTDEPKIIEQIEYRNVYEKGLSYSAHTSYESAESNRVSIHSEFGKYIKTIKTKVRGEI